MKNKYNTCCMCDKLLELEVDRVYDSQGDCYCDECVDDLITLGTYQNMSDFLGFND